MQLKSLIALIGTLIDIAGIAALYIGLGIGLISLLVVVVVSILSYIIASIGAASRSSISAFGNLCGVG